jgi:hypothetical protein
VSLALAKDQRLSLNPSQISGGCGRLLCCLRYEHDFYVTTRKRFPKEGKELQTGRGVERVQAVDLFRERVLLRAEDGSTRSLTLGELRLEASESPGTPESAEIRPPSALAAFDEGDTPLTPERAADAVTPAPRRRRRRGRRGGGPRSDSPGGRQPPPADDAGAGSGGE